MLKNVKKIIYCHFKTFVIFDRFSYKWLVSLVKAVREGSPFLVCQFFVTFLQKSTFWRVLPY